MLRRWLFAPLLSELSRLNLNLERWSRTMTTEMDDLQAAEVDLATEMDQAVAQIEQMTNNLANASPSGAETIAQNIRAQTARLRAALAAQNGGAPAPVAPVTPAPVEPTTGETAQTATGDQPVT